MQTQIETLLELVQAADGCDAALAQQRSLPYENKVVCQLDHHRSLRNGIPKWSLPARAPNR
jgi:hypothetical protein